MPVIPEKIEVGAYTYDVEYSDSVDLIRNTRGECHTHTKKIILATPTIINKEQHHHEVFLHEVVEAVNDEFDLKLDHHAITLIGQGMAQALRFDMYRHKGPLPKCDKPRMNCEQRCPATGYCNTGDTNCCDAEDNFIEPFNCLHKPRPESCTWRSEDGRCIASWHDGCGLVRMVRRTYKQKMHSGTADNDQNTSS
jgi:hypothetical protein